MSRSDNIPHILILGGTADARIIAHLLHGRLGDSVQLTTSLAGRTKTPGVLSGDIRTGGFGGVDGLVDYLETNNISFLIDATHPFAAVISEHAADAAKKTGTKRLSIVRPPWKLPDTLDVSRVTSMAEAAELLGAIRADRALITTGIKNLAAFASVPDVFFLVRLIEQPENPLPLKNAQVVIQKPPYTLNDEKVLMSENRINVLVSKESGGQATEAKLLAADALGVRTILIERPTAPTGDTVPCPDAALSWVLEQIN